MTNLGRCRLQMLRKEIPTEESLIDGAVSSDVLHVRCTLSYPTEKKVNSCLSNRAWIYFEESAGFKGLRDASVSAFGFSWGCVLSALIPETFYAPSSSSLCALAYSVRSDWYIIVNPPESSAIYPFRVFFPRQLWIRLWSKEKLSQITGLVFEPAFKNAAYHTKLCSVCATQAQHTKHCHH